MSSAPHDRLPSQQPIRPRSMLPGLLAFLWFMAIPAQAHDVLTQYVQHHIQLIATPKHLDLTVTLTFFEAWSQKERTRMDQDGNALLQRTEIASYLKRLEDTFLAAVRLSVDGQPVPLIPLYEPEVDLLDNRQTSRSGRHRLTLHFFALTPDRMKTGSRVLLEERLWPETRALGVWHAEGRSGCELIPVELEDPAFPPLAEGSWRRFQAQCARPPRQPQIQVPSKSPVSNPSLSSH